MFAEHSRFLTGQVLYARMACGITSTASLKGASAMARSEERCATSAFGYEVPPVRDLGLAKFAKLPNFANFWRARSRLYQSEILQENMRSTAFFKLYKICILLHRCNLKIFAKNRFEKTAIFVKFQQKNCKCRKICKILSNFKNFSLRIW